MRVKELRDYLNSLESYHDNDVICVRVFDPKTFGGTPTVSIKSIHNGFDWDSGRHIIVTDPEVIRLKTEEKRDIIIDDIVK